MNKFRFTINALAIAIFTFAFASMTQAQATRTWVSGVGDDANPCSRTAPCKTFAGAISKTADGGEIDALDPGGFGTVTITKSVTIDGTTGAGFAGVLAAGTNGIIVNDSGSGAPNSKIVSLRNLSINGAVTGFDGIRILSAKEVNIEGCIIANFKGNGTNSDGVDIAYTTAVAGNQDVKITNCIIRDVTGNGIRVQNTAGGGAVLVTVDNCHLDTSFNGIGTTTGAIVQVANSFFTFNTNAGLSVQAGTSQVDVDSCDFHSNANGITSAASTTRIANCRISGNGNGLNFTGGVIQSFGDNKVKGNFNNDQLGGSVTAVPAPAKI